MTGPSILWEPSTPEQKEWAQTHLHHHWIHTDQHRVSFDMGWMDLPREWWPAVPHDTLKDGGRPIPGPAWLGILGRDDLWENR